MPAWIDLGSALNGVDNGCSDGRELGAGTLPAAPLSPISPPSCSLARLRYRFSSGGFHHVFRLHLLLRPRSELG